MWQIINREGERGVQSEIRINSLQKIKSKTKATT